MKKTEVQRENMEFEIVCSIKIYSCSRKRNTRCEHIFNVKHYLMDGM